MSGPVLLCYDGSDEAAVAIRRAGELLAGRDALVLTVAVPAERELPVDPVGDLVGRLSGMYHEWDELAGELAERHARRGCELAAEAGLHAEPLTATGRPAEAILLLAQERGASVIVLGLGRPGVLGLGSVSAHVVHDAACPVLAIPGS